MTTETEIAWCGGFFDGEGCTHTTGRYLGITIGQCNRETLDRFLAAVKVGTVSGPYLNQKHPHWSPKWDYRSGGREAHAVIQMLLPYLSGPKKEQYEYISSITVLPRRKGYCNKDLHELSGSNLDPDGRCKACRQAMQRRLWARNK